MEGLGRLIGTAVLGIARVQVHDGGTGLRGSHRGIGNLLRRDREVRGHGGRVNGSGDGTGDNDFTGFGHRGISSHAAGGSHPTGTDAMLSPNARPAQAYSCTAAGAAGWCRTAALMISTSMVSACASDLPLVMSSALALA